MESRAGVEECRRFREPDPEMEEGGYRTPHKPIYATQVTNIQTFAFVSSLQISTVVLALTDNVTYFQF